MNKTCRKQDPPFHRAERTPRLRTSQTNSSSSHPLFVNQPIKRPSYRPTNQSTNFETRLSTEVSRWVHTRCANTIQQAVEVRGGWRDRGRSTQWTIVGWWFPDRPRTEEEAEVGGLTRNPEGGLSPLRAARMKH